MMTPVRQRLVPSASSDGAQVAVLVIAYRHDHRLADAGGTRLHPRPGG